MKPFSTLRLLILLFIGLLVINIRAQAFSENDIFRSSYDKDSNKSSVLLKGLALPDNEDNFSVGAAFEFNGESLEKTPCCVIIFFTSMSSKGFEFKKNHKLKVWAGAEKFTFDNVTWQESSEGTAFIIAGMAYPEEILVGMKADTFRKIAASKNVKMQLGDFKFTLTIEQLSGFNKILEKMTVK